MANSTSIEWTRGDDGTEGKVWNPATGCDKVSKGCENCYAMGGAKRWKAAGSPRYQSDGDPRTSGPGFGITMHEDLLTVPLHWRKPRRIFVNSMSDLFHKGISDDFIARVFAIMSLTPQHTYQILTKRHGRMRSLLSNPDFEKQVDQALLTMPAASDSKLTKKRWPLPKPGWPLPNVWLGVSVEDQKAADLRIPHLVQTPAAVRFLSCEPMVGPVDLSRWMTPISPLPLADAPRAWGEWTWPDWVPADVRNSVQDFWKSEHRYGPHSWMSDMHIQGAPGFGARVTLRNGFSSNAPFATGRYVHVCNNVGRLVLDDGTWAYTSFGSRARRNQMPIRWVIVGGESGVRARPFDPQWATDVVADVSAAGSAPFVKQLGSVWAKANRAKSTKGSTPEEWPTWLRIREYPAAGKLS